MQIRYSFLLVLLAFFSSCADSNQSSQAPAEFAVDVTGYEQSDLPDGVTRLIKKNENGLVIEEGYLKDGKPNGIWTTFQEDRVLTMTSYVNGVLNGKSFEFDHRRQIIEEATYVNGILNGKKGSYKFGRPKLEEYYLDGERHGSYRKYYESGKDQGKISQTIEYVEGKIDGKVMHYNAEGEVTVEYTYRNGEKISGGIVE